MTERDVSDDAYIDGIKNQNRRIIRRIIKGLDQPFSWQLECLNHIYRSLTKKYWDL